MSNFICVFVGGGLGAVCRYGLICLIGMPWGLHFPLATLLINAISCFFMGLIMGLPLVALLYFMCYTVGCLAAVIRPALSTPTKLLRVQE